MKITQCRNWNRATSTLTVLLILTFCSHSAVAQRKPVEPVNMAYDSELSGFESKTQEAYVYAGKYEGGLYIPALIIKPDGEGPIPTVVAIHGSPGGRTMSDLKISSQRHGFVTDRFLEEGYLVVRCSYRLRRRHENEPSGKDVAAVLRFVKTLPEVDARNVFIYGGSRGAENSVIALGEESVTAAVLNAPGGYTYLGLVDHETAPHYAQDVLLTEEQYDRKTAISFLEKIETPTLFVVGSEDPGHIPNVNTTVALLKELGKESSVDFYPGEKHGFYWGGIRQKNGSYKPAGSLVKALDKAVTFFSSKTE